MLFDLNILIGRRLCAKISQNFSLARCFFFRFFLHIVFIISSGSCTFDVASSRERDPRLAAFTAHLQSTSVKRKNERELTKKTRQISVLLVILAAVHNHLEMHHIALSSPTLDVEILSIFQAHHGVCAAQKKKKIN